MNTNHEINIEALLPDYFSHHLSQHDRELVETWKDSTKENLDLFNEYRELWDSMGRLKEMEEIDTRTALKKVTTEIGRASVFQVYFSKIQRIAAILLLPLMAYSGFLTISRIKDSKQPVAWYTVNAKQGSHSEVELPDGSKVWLNSGASIAYPQKFEKNHREVKLLGEAYFDVAHNPKHPFVVNTGTINVEVLGTKFNLISEPAHESFELVLESGKVSLFSGDYESKTNLKVLKPGQRAYYNPKSGKIAVTHVEVDKYTSWRDGFIIFRDDNMPEVAAKLGRWFNVQVVIRNPELNDYLFTAKFKDETLVQILDLIKLSSPVEYSIVKSKKNENDTYSQTIIYIDKKRR